MQNHKNDLEKAHQKEIRAKSAMEKLESITIIQEIEQSWEVEARKNLLKWQTLTSKRKVVPFYVVNHKPKNQKTKTFSSVESRVYSFAYQFWANWTWRNIQPLKNGQ